MIPITGRSLPGIPEPARDTTGDAANAASLFAAIFAATSAGRVPVVPVAAIPEAAARASTPGGGTSAAAAGGKVPAEAPAAPVLPPATMGANIPRVAARAAEASRVRATPARTAAAEDASHATESHATEPHPTESHATESHATESRASLPLVKVVAVVLPGEGVPANAPVEAQARPKTRTSFAAAEAAVNAKAAPIPAAIITAAVAQAATPQPASAREVPEPVTEPPPATARELESRPQPAPVSHATVAFDNGDGQEGRLHVTLRGSTVRATLQMPDAASAGRIEHDLGGLARSLRQQGFEAARLAVDARPAPVAAGRGQDASTRDDRKPREQTPHGGERSPRRDHSRKQR